MADEKKKDERPYWMQRRDSKLAAVLKPAEQKAATKDALGVWYDLQATMAPATCENCGRSLAATIKFHPRAHICHIVEKSPVNGCPSVATHPLNRWFGCLHCHTAYDKESAEVVETMEVIPIVKERLKHFYYEIKQSEVRRVPSFLVPVETVTMEDEPREDPAPSVKKLRQKAKPKKKKTTKEHGKKAGPPRDAHGQFIPKSARTGGTAAR